jgi:hypothetical protein
MLTMTRTGLLGCARDVFAGEDALKVAGGRYPPQLDAQTSEEYNAYRARASYINSTARTVDGFVGLIFRREPTVKLAEAATGFGRALAALIDDEETRRRLGRWVIKSCVPLPQAFDKSSGHRNGGRLQ